MRKFLGWVVVFLVVVSVATVALASFTDTKIDVSFRNIRIIRNGTVVKSEFEPFIYNGHVYVALKDIAKIFSTPVEWDSDTNSVILGSKTKKYYSLAEIPFTEEKLEEQPDGSFVNTGSSFNEALSGVRFATINGEVFKDSLLFGGSGKEYFKFPLDQKFDYLSFVAGVTDNSISITPDDSVTIKIFGDSELLYASPLLKPGKGAVFVRIPVGNVNVLTIEKDINGNSILNAAIVNAKLTVKKEQ